MDKLYKAKSTTTTIKAIFAEAKKFKGMKQKLKSFRSILRQSDCCDRTFFKRGCVSAMNTSQMMDVPLYRGVKDLACRKVSRTNQTLLYKNLKVSIYSGQTHRVIAVKQLPMQFLTTQFVITLFEFLKQLFLPKGNFGISSTHTKDLQLISFNEHTEY